MKTTTISFYIQIYSFQGAGWSSFKTQDEWKLKENDLLAVLQPEKKIDPMGVYTFAVNANLGSISVRRKALKKVKRVRMAFNRKPYMSSNEEMGEMIMVTKEYMVNEEAEKELKII